MNEPPLPAGAPHRPHRRPRRAHRVRNLHPRVDSGRSGALGVVADVVGLDHGKVAHRDPGVEANARLTGTTGLLLLVMLAAEGLTLASIHQLISWHIAIGVALIPPVALKLGATGWRFSRYYLGDRRYRQAGPPHPILRVLGPLVVLSTVAVLATGVAAWLSGPGSHGLRTLHVASFIVWFAFMAVHVVAHVLRASRLARADLSRTDRRQVPGRGVRQGLVVASLVAGVALGFATTAVTSGWSSGFHFRH